MYREQIHCQGYEGMTRRKYSLRYHVAHYNRGRGVRLYLCGCGRPIKVGSRFIFPFTSTKQSNFQQRSYHNIRTNK